MSESKTASVLFDFCECAGSTGDYSFDLETSTRKSDIVSILIDLNLSKILPKLLAFKDQRSQDLLCFGSLSTGAVGLFRRVSLLSPFLLLATLFLLLVSAIGRRVLLRGRSFTRACYTLLFAQEQLVELAYILIILLLEVPLVEPEYSVLDDEAENVLEVHPRQNLLLVDC